MHELSAAALVAAYRKSRLSPVEVAEAALARVAERDGELRAFCLVDGDRALASARASEARWAAGEPAGLLDGVPVAVKDILLTRGWPTLRGSRTISPAGPWEDDAPTVAALRRHGAVLPGKLACRVRIQREVHRLLAQRVDDLKLTARRQIERTNQVQPSAIPCVTRHLELSPHRLKAHLAASGVDGWAHTGAYQLTRLVQQRGGYDAVSLASPDRFLRALDLEVCQARRRACDLTDDLCVQSGGNGAVTSRLESFEHTGVEEGLIRVQAETPEREVRHLGRKAGKGESELLEIQRLT